MAQEIRTPQFLCLKCRYELAGFEIGQVCPECGSKIERLVDQSKLSNSKVVAVMIFGVLSLLSVVLTVVLFPFQFIIQWQLFGITCGLVAAIYAMNLRYGVRTGKIPFRSLRWIRLVSIFGWVGFVLSILLACTLLIGMLLLIMMSKSI